MLDNYSKYCGKLILRDELALDRTVLANERTMLSYIRSFIALFAAGIGVVKLIENSDFWTVLGYAFIIASPAFLIVGIKRYFRMHRKLMTLDDNQKPEQAG